MTATLVRAADLDAAPDVAALTALRRQWTTEQDDAGPDLRDDPHRPLDDEGFGAEFTIWLRSSAGTRLFWLALDDGCAVGMVNVAEFARMPRPGRPPSRWGYVANAYVTPPFRDRGIGTQLLDACVAHGRAAGYARLVLHPSQRSRALYERAGFRPAQDLLLLAL